MNKVALKAQKVAKYRVILMQRGDDINFFRYFRQTVMTPMSVRHRRSSCII